MTYTDEAIEAAIAAYWKAPWGQSTRSKRMEDALTAADAAMEAAGWVRVPVEPTADMVEAPFVGAIEQQDFVMQTKKRKAMAANYRAMIAARPDTTDKG